jgi:N-acetylneuraminate synthase
MQIIAEIGINHNGALGFAFQMMRMAKDCGADFVKFQKRDIDTVYTREFLDSPRESPWGTTQREQKEGLELSIAQFKEIDKYSKTIELPWFASSWDLKSLAEMESFNPPFHKVASPMLTNRHFLHEVAKLRRMALISCGGSEWLDIDYAVEIFRGRGCPFALFHCVSEYPCPDERVNLAMIGELQISYPDVAIGYSNHSPGIESCVGAAYLGASFIEIHITLDRSSYGSDQAASLERRGVELVCKYAKNAGKIIGDGVRIISATEKANMQKMRYWENR